MTKVAHRMGHGAVFASFFMVLAMALVGAEVVNTRSEETEKDVQRYEEELRMKVGETRGSNLGGDTDGEERKGQTWTWTCGEGVEQTYAKIADTDADEEPHASQASQHDNMVECVVETIRRLIALTEFTPEAIADTLGGTLRVRSGGEYRVDYELTGELPGPMQRAKVSYGPKSGWTYVEIELAMGYSIPLDAIAYFFQDRPFTFRPATTVHPPHGSPLQYVFKVPVGELGLEFPNFGEEYVLRSFYLSNEPSVRWGKDAGTLREFRDWTRNPE